MIAFPRIVATGLLAAVTLVAACEESPSPQRYEVDITALRFVPAELTVLPGDTVVWTNRDIVPHTVTDSRGSFDSEEMARGERFELVISAPGILTYGCDFHPSMQGTLRIDSP